MNPSLLSEHDQSSVDNKAMDFGIASGMFIRYLRNDRRFLDSKRQKQKEDIEHAMSGEKKSRRGRRKRRTKKLKSIIISELPSFSQQNVSDSEFSQLIIFFEGSRARGGRNDGFFIRVLRRRQRRRSPENHIFRRLIRRRSARDERVEQGEEKGEKKTGKGERKGTSETQRG